jgi:hypothetical protein
MRFPEEECFAVFGIARELNGLASALQEAQVSDDIVDLLLAEEGEGRHPGARDSMLDDTRDVSIGEMLYFGRGGDVGRVFSAPPIGSVTTGTVRRKNSCPVGLRSQGTGREQPQNGGSYE